MCPFTGRNVPDDPSRGRSGLVHLGGLGQDATRGCPACQQPGADQFRGPTPTTPPLQPRPSRPRGHLHAGPAGARPGPAEAGPGPAEAGRPGPAGSGRAGCLGPAGAGRVGCLGPARAGRPGPVGRPLPARPNFRPHSHARWLHFTGCLLSSAGQSTALVKRGSSVRTRQGAHGRRAPAGLGWGPLASVPDVRRLSVAGLAPRLVASGPGDGRAAGPCG